ncbi:MFS transporter [Streptomyces sp. NPDC096142]|uniref:MFS transporter n=1 Tax=Streptomyces sp. NPDC096142 TaxID=3366077 RepID=UPI00381988C3
MGKTPEGEAQSDILTDPDRPAPLRLHRPFLLLWSGQTLSMVGSEVSVLVLPLIAVELLGATTFQTALLTFFGSLAFLLISLPAGVVVDRVDKRRLMLGCDLARMVLIGSIPVTALWGGVTLGQLYAVVATAGALTVFFDIAAQSYLPVLVDRSQLADGNGKLGASASVAQLAGPSLAGALVTVMGLARTVALDAASYALSVVSLLLIRTPGPPPEPPRAPTAAGTPRAAAFRAAVAEGLRFVLRDPVLRAIVACTATSNFFITAIESVQMVYLTRTLHARPAQIGLILGFGAVAGLAGGLLAGRLSARVGSARIIWVSLLVPGVLYVLLPLAGTGAGLTLYALGWAALSLAAVVYNTAQISYRQAICPPELLGRMNASVRWVVWGTMPLGALFGGALGTWIGLRPCMWLCALGAWAAGLLLLLSPLRRMRDQ